MRAIALPFLIAPVAFALSTAAFAETVVIKRESSGHSEFGHQQWRNGHARGDRNVVIRERSDTTGSVVHKKVIRRSDGMGGHTTTVIKRTTTDE